MNRPWKVWLAFGLCAAVVLAALAWISLTALRLDRAQIAAQQQAEIEERVRLALWRMDAELSPLMVEESARPWSAYAAFSATERAYAKTGDNYSQVRQGDFLVPSPLLAFASSNVLLHFQLSAQGQVTSPQAPEGEQRALAEASYTTPAQAAAATARLAAMRRLLAQPATAAVGDNGGLLRRDTIESSLPALPLAPSQAVALNDPRQAPEAQAWRNSTEFAQRANLYNRAQQQAVVGNQILSSGPVAAVPSAGLLKPFWLGDNLVLARRGPQDGGAVVQGVWLNWPHLRATLLDSARDLLPGARLEPVPAGSGAPDARRLAALPVRLIPGPVPAASFAPWTPVRFSLALAWAGVLLAAAAVAILLHGILALSERRAAFVAAVTHELRTPLTTFRMYSEMLAEDMVPDAAQRQTYLRTLCAESGRLSHLVENVLAYARLERGSARRRVERVPLGELLQRVQPRLQERAIQAGMSLRETVDAPTASTTVCVDVSAVEQILFNLVDNACKYAAPDSTEKVIHLEALPEPGKYALLRVRDHGQGISAAGAKRLFQPFSKSANEAAHSAPGVGLGLALCRRLSRSLGGDLRLDASGGRGAAFVLSLPVSNVTA
jgi:signal transduction histidine kinase